ncbi:reverse transcriptase domain-containing protein [Tanacetum coccineum]
MNILNIEVEVDSKLVASQINESYEASKDSMIKYLAKAKEYASGFKSFSIENILRNMNQKENVLSKLASVAFNHLTKEVLVEVLNERSTEGQEVHAIVEEEGDNWMTPIVRCLEEGIWPKDKNEARCLRAKIGQYTMESRILFKKGYLVPMLRCVGPLQANYVIREIHIGSCGMHVGPRVVVRKAVRQGYYWPTMHEDVTRWGMDILGPLPPTRGGASLFGLPRIIVTDNGVQLVNDPFKSWYQDPPRKRKGLDGLTSCQMFCGHIELQSNKAMERYHSVLPRTERREVVAIREAKYKTKMKQYYNKKVCPSGFRLGEFVFRRNEASRVEDQGKLRPKWEGPYKVVEAYENGSYKLQILEDKEVPKPGMLSISANVICRS